MKNLTVAAVFALAFLAHLSHAQSPSGLLTGPVTYTSTLTSGNAYGDNTVWTVANTATLPTTPPTAANSYTCSASGVGPGGTTLPNCFILEYANFAYYNLQASDGTSTGWPNCYTWYFSQFILDDTYPLGNGCENSFHGGGSGEYRTDITCPVATVTNTNGVYAYNGSGCNFGGTAIQVINGADVPITNTFTVAETVDYTPVWIWEPAHYRTQAHWAHWVQINSMNVLITPQNPPASASTNVDGGPSPYVGGGPDPH